MSAFVPTLRAKAGFTWTQYPPGGFHILAVLEQAAKVLTRDLELTAGTNDHTTGAHVTGSAFDVSVKGLTVPQILKLHTFLTRNLGVLFTVLFECPVLPADPQLHGIAFINGDATGPHIHVQVSKGARWPPDADIPTGVIA